MLLDHFGGQTPAEQALNIVSIQSNDDLEDDAQFDAWMQSCDADIPLKIAELWSINPNKLPEMNLPLSTGYLAYIQK